MKAVSDSMRRPARGATARTTPIDLAPGQRVAVPPRHPFRLGDHLIIICDPFARDVGLVEQDWAESLDAAHEDANGRLPHEPGYVDPAAPMPRVGVIGTVYLLHFEPGLPVRRGQVARHYIGWTERNVADRLADHIEGRGSPLVRAVVAAGGDVTVERTWPEVDRFFERRLKNRKEAPRLCPRCVADGETRNQAVLLERAA